MPARTSDDAAPARREVAIPPLGLGGSLNLPRQAQGLVIFAHGSGSSRFSVRNVAVAEALNARRFATLLFDLLTDEEAEDRCNVFDIPLLAGRLSDAVRWAGTEPATAALPVGLFGASTGAAAALVAAAELGETVRAVVSRGGRPDLAGAALPEVTAATLLIVGGEDYGVIELNEQAFAALRCEKAMEIVPGATHLFPEPGALEAVMALAEDWFGRHVRRG
jgi:putative phosphoribosyl transferase